MTGVKDLTVCCWTWGYKYSPEYVKRLAAGVQRHLKTPFRFRVFEPGDEDTYLTKIPGCFARLRMFDPQWQADNDITGRLVCMDLDSVVTGSLDGTFDRSEPLVVLHGGNASNPCKFNGSLMMVKAGAHSELWRDFDASRVSDIPHFEFPDDQGWIWHKVPGAAGWKVGPESGVYAFQKPGWPKGTDLPRDARLVVFPGWRDPSKFADLEWVKEHWS